MGEISVNYSFKERPEKIQASVAVSLNLEYCCAFVAPAAQLTVISLA